LLGALPLQTNQTGTSMQTFSQNAALLIIDVQNGFDEPYWGRRNNPQMEARIVDLLGAWRESNRPVIHAKHMSVHPGSPLRPGQSGNDFKDRMTPMPGEYVVEKRVNSCFIGTPLEAELRRRRHDTLVIVGMTTNHCVSTTTRMAGDLGFDAWVVSDATATFDRVGPDGIHYPAEQIQAIALSDLNGEFGRVVDTATVLAAAEMPLVETFCARATSVTQEYFERPTAASYANPPFPCEAPNGLAARKIRGST
jgi:nicotinamidase-related amidase